MRIPCVVASSVSDDRSHPSASVPDAPDTGGPAPEIRALLRQLPKVDAVLARADVRALDAPRWAVVQAIRDEIAALRQAVLAGARPVQPDVPPDAAPDMPIDMPIEVPIDVLVQRIATLVQPSLRRVINAAGVVLHTNLGRAPLAAEALAQVTAVAGGYSNLEYDLAGGGRGSRHGHVTDLLTALTGAEDAVVVNNNAGAVLLALAALATGREVVVSRGELVEIGGSFRVPDVMRLSGAHLVEVGTTNKTRIADYAAAVTERTGLLLKVHPSNFAIVGFTEEARPDELAALGREVGVPAMMDLGSGSLLEPAALAAMGLPPEPGVRALVAAGLDVITFSGDKLLGGPQAGILCGRAAWIERCRRHPLMRALRPDKMTLAALEATLALYREGHRVPAVAMLAAPAEAVRRRAETALARVRVRLAGYIQGAPRIDVALAQCASTVGGGAMPTATLPSWGLALAPAPGAALAAGDIERLLRRAVPAVIGRIADDRVILDLRTVQDSDIEPLADAVVAACVT